jgi:hypothetical protein
VDVSTPTSEPALSLEDLKQSLLRMTEVRARLELCAWCQAKDGAGLLFGARSLRRHDPQ